MINEISNHQNIQQPSGQDEFIQPRSASIHYINTFAAQRCSDESNTYPPLPIAIDFGSEDLHAYEAKGNWDIKRAITENGGAIVRSIRTIKSSSTTGEDLFENVTFKFGARSFISGNTQTIRGYSSTFEGVKNLVDEFIRKYAQPEKPEGGSFFLIKTEGNNISTQRVILEPKTQLSDEDFELLYPK